MPEPSAAPPRTTPGQLGLQPKQVVQATPRPERVTLPHSGLHRIVVVGGGAGGLELVTRLGNKLGRKRKAEVALVDTSLRHTRDRHR